MKTWFKASTVILFSSFSLTSSAAPGDSVPNIFTANTTASAAEVNANFQELVTQISTLAANPVQTIYDYNDFGHNLSQKVFTVQHSNDSFDTEIHVFRRTATTMEYDRVRQLAGTTNRFHTLHFDTTNDLVLTHWESWSNDGVTLQGTTTFTPGITVRKTDMTPGIPWVSGVSVESYDEIGFTSTYSASIAEYKVHGIEDVVANGTNYTGCLKTSSLRTGLVFGNLVRHVNWHCPNVGLVKRIHTQENGGSWHTRVMELSSTTP